MAEPDRTPRMTPEEMALLLAELEATVMPGGRWRSRRLTAEEMAALEADRARAARTDPAEEA